MKFKVEFKLIVSHLCTQVMEAQAFVGMEVMPWGGGGEGSNCQNGGTPSYAGSPGLRMKCSGLRTASLP